jgi:hypothetical protein
VRGHSIVGASFPPWVLPRWDLEFHQATPDLEAVEQVLGHRYGYWTDDVAHPPLFGPDPRGESTSV